MIPWAHAPFDADRAIWRAQRDHGVAPFRHLLPTAALASPRERLRWRDCMTCSHFPARWLKFPLAKSS